MDDEQRNLLIELVSDLVRGDFCEIARDGRNGELTEFEFRNELDRYPGKLSMPPKGAFEQVDYFPRTGEEESIGLADFDLWIDGKRSDLTLQVRYVKLEGRWRIYIYTIHVL